MEFVSIEEARKASGLRLVVSGYNWAGWSECAKQLMYAKGIDHLYVEQIPYSENAELVAWTGVRNQPQAIWNDEPVRSSWLDILNLAERIKPEPRLLPEDSDERALVVGVSNELCGEQGLAWCRRVQLGSMPTLYKDRDTIMVRDYGAKYGGDVSWDEQRMAQIVDALGVRLRAQEKEGGRYLVGRAFSAADLYWAVLSNLFNPMDADVCPMRPALRAQFADPTAAVAKVLDPILLEHREYIYRTYLRLPMDFDYAE